MHSALWRRNLSLMHHPLQRVAGANRAELPSYSITCCDQLHILRTWRILTDSSSILRLSVPVASIQDTFCYSGVHNAVW